MHRYLKLFLIFGINKLTKCDNIVNLEVISTFSIEPEYILSKKDIILIKNIGELPLQDYYYYLNETNVLGSKFFNKNSELRSKKINHLFIKVYLGENVPPNETFAIGSYIKYVNGIVPAQKYRKFEELQLFKIVENLFFFSPYQTNYYEIKYGISSDLIVEISHKNYITVDDDIIFEFRNVSSFRNETFVLIYYNNKPFLRITSLERSIYVSHYGTCTITDHVTIQNRGARLLNFDYKDHNFVYSTHLPASADNINFYDDLGTLFKFGSTVFFDYITVSFHLRYPLKAGSWKTNYFLRYTVPSHEYLFESINDSFVLKIRGIDHVLNNVIIEEVSVSVILPEGARINNYVTGDKLKFIGTDSSWAGGLNVGSRPVVLFGAINVDDQYDLLEIHYGLSPLYFFKTPLVLVCYLQGFFLVVILGNYLFFSKN